MIRTLTVALGLGLLPAAVLAQDIDTDATYEAARNQLGILQYCQDQGFTGAEAVTAQGQLIAMLPEGDATAGTTAEEKGTEGMVAVGEAELSLADAAESQGNTVEVTCQQIEAAVNEVAPTLPAG
ncbi:hypothetical protein E4L95_07980 [Paracoccus liaowanqingii]|uniref:Uncharacterized protein n=1 Tax=Paracoccus liaowanqingii TaxID=2560053 RepID=A0A4P7HN85_9RHOB|nr:pore-forming ESAT-6 family protein [Paracoccus liaowanqingii]QBX35695.1 hypothetical protein E4191_14075 [Paracoccus liaowanqingii]TGN62090.1 hypothetical protein E4L95_07980 [Paracoccus liaowanqingii]